MRMLSVLLIHRIHRLLRLIVFSCRILILSGISWKFSNSKGILIFLLEIRLMLHNCFWIRHFWNRKKDSINYSSTKKIMKKHWNSSKTPTTTATNNSKKSKEPNAFVSKQNSINSVEVTNKLINFISKLLIYLINNCWLSGVIGCWWVLKLIIKLMRINGRILLSRLYPIRLDIRFIRQNCYLRRFLRFWRNWLLIWLSRTSWNLLSRIIYYLWKLCCTGYPKSSTSQ